MRKVADQRFEVANVLLVNKGVRARKQLVQKDRDALALVISPGQRQIGGDSAVQRAQLAHFTGAQGVAPLVPVDQRLQPFPVLFPKSDKIIDTACLSHEARFLLCLIYRTTCKSIRPKTCCSTPRSPGLARAALRRWWTISSSLRCC